MNKEVRIYNDVVEVWARISNHSKIVQDTAPAYKWACRNPLDKLVSYLESIHGFMFIQEIKPDGQVYDMCQLDKMESVDHAKTKSTAKTDGEVSRRNDEGASVPKTVNLKVFPGGRSGERKGKGSFIAKRK